MSRSLKEIAMKIESMDAASTDSSGAPMTRPSRVARPRRWRVELLRASAPQPALQRGQSALEDARVDWSNSRQRRPAQVTSARRGSTARSQYQVGRQQVLAIGLCSHGGRQVEP